MLRKALGAAVAGLLVAVMVAASAPSPAAAQPTKAVQTAPANNCTLGGATYPPGTTPGLNVRLRLDLGLFQLEVAAASSVRISGFDGPGPWCLVLRSDPVVIGDAIAVNGTATWSGFTVPSDFELDAPHRFDVYRLGTLVGSLPFCARTSGPQQGTAVELTSSCEKGASRIPQTLGSKAKPSGNLAYTGFDLMLDLLKAAAVVLALGAILRYAARKRASNFTA